ncbi:alpha/beta hydrolase [Anaerolineae bacterium CFX9]|nr:alpha/beta hydrolase [Kamptonema cortianum]MDL1902304.1 alpha/beta hydrolase [Anaerolineae bacterium CFX9]
MKRWLVRILIVLALLIFVVPMLIPLPPVGVEASVLAEPDGRFVEVNGLSTYVREAGDPDAPPVLLLHGWGGSTFSWREQIQPLAQAGYRVIAFDRPPYGLSAKTGDGIPYSQRAQAEFTAAFMSRVGVQRAVLVGHSMGGGVIGYFAALYPDRVDGLVFVDGAVRIAETTPSNGSGSTRLNDAMGIPSFVNQLLAFPPVNWWARLGLRAFVRPEMFTSMQRSAYYDPEFVTDEVAAGYQEQLRVQGWDEALIEILRGASFGDAPLTESDLAQITTPSLIVWGEDDTWVPISAGERLRDLLPNNTFVVYPQTGHLPMEEQPEAFNRDLLNFLANLPAGAQ